jgi:hypothetical protein
MTATKLSRPARFVSEFEVNTKTARSVVAQYLSNLRKENRKIERLGNHLIHSEVFGTSHRLDGSKRSEEQAPCAPVGFFHSAECFKAIHARHPQVEEHEDIRLTTRQFNGLFAAAGGIYVVAHIVQNVGQRLTLVLIIIDDKKCHDVVDPIFWTT